MTRPTEHHTIRDAFGRWTTLTFFSDGVAVWHDGMKEAAEGARAAIEEDAASEGVPLLEWDDVYTEDAAREIVAEWEAGDEFAEIWQKY